MGQISAQDEIVRTIRTHGAITFREYMERALYGAGGYYQRQVQIGNEGADFFTAAQSPLFAKTVARYVRRSWQEFGAPQHIQVVELGAGQGELALHVCLHLRDILPANITVTYTIVDVSLCLQEVQRRRLKQVSDARLHISWSRPLPNVPTVLLANEVLDAQPVEQVRKTAHGWEQAYIVYTKTETFARAWYPAEPALAEAADMWLPIENDCVADIAVGNEALFSGCARYGTPLRALFFDYGIVRAEWVEGVRPQGTVRGYRHHQVVDVLTDPGTCDITADVYWDFAAATASRTGFTVSGITTQGSFLINEGILELLEEENRNAASDPLKVARLTGQFKQLVLPGGMGERFSVMECRM